MDERPSLRRPRRIVGRVGGGVSVFLVEVFVVLAFAALALGVAALVLRVF